MDLFWQATTIMVLGMGLVLVFLSAVIACVQVSARLVQRHEARAAGRSGDAVQEDLGAVVAAIAVALHEHR